MGTTYEARFYWEARLGRRDPFVLYGGGKDRKKLGRLFHGRSWALRLPGHRGKPVRSPRGTTPRSSRGSDRFPRGLGLQRWELRRPIGCVGWDRGCANSKRAE